MDFNLIGLNFIGLNFIGLNFIEYMYHGSVRVKYFTLKVEIDSTY